MKEKLLKAKYIFDLLVDLEDDDLKQTKKELSLYIARLRKEIYKDAPIIKTPQELKEGVHKMISQSIHRILDKNEEKEV